LPSALMNGVRFPHQVIATKDLNVSGLDLR
jgi:hypothetical protein